MGRLGNSAQVPVPGKLPLAFHGPGVGDIAHGSGTLVSPGGRGHGEMPLQGADTVVPTAVVHVLPAQVVDVPVVVGVLLHRELQQGQILCPGFGGIGQMVQLHSFHGHCGARTPLPGPVQYFVDRMYPLIPMAGVYLFVPKNHTLGTVWIKAPGVAVSCLACAGPPGCFQQLPPAGVEHLVQVGAYADIRILWHQFH